MFSKISFVADSTASFHSRGHMTGVGHLARILPVVDLTSQNGH